MNNSAYTWYFPITKDNFHIIGEGNAVVYGNEFAENGIWSHQNLVTVSGDNVTIEGITFMPKNENNKTLEVLGANFIMKNCTVTSNTIKNYGLFAGNVWVDSNGSTFDGNTFDYSGITVRVGRTSVIKNITFNYGSRADSWDNECVSARGTAILENNTFNNIQPVWTNSADPTFGNNNYPILTKGNGVINIKSGNQFPDANIYWTAQDDGVIQIDGTPISYIAANGLAAAISGGGTINLRATEYAVGTGITINRTVTINGGGALLSAVSPTTRAVTGNGKNPVIFISSGDVILKDITISADQTPANNGVDGITITGGTLKLENVTIDGILNAGGPSGAQYGRGVIVYNGTTLNAVNSTFKRFNKNAIHLYDTSSATIDHCTFIGNNKLGLNAQNGVVFMETATGTISNSSFSNIIYDGETSCAVMLYGGSEDRVTDGGGNTYSNNDRNWVWGI
jgi:hypothetical protein